VALAQLHILDGDLDVNEGHAEMAADAWRDGLTVLGDRSAARREPVELLTRIALLVRAQRVSDVDALRNQLTEMGFSHADAPALTGVLIDGARNEPAQ
jgi:hypothetical protein